LLFRRSNCCLLRSMMLMKSRQWPIQIPLLVNIEQVDTDWSIFLHWTSWCIVGLCRCQTDSTTATFHTFKIESELAEKRKRCWERTTKRRVINSAEQWNSTLKSNCPNDSTPTTQQELLYNVASESKFCLEKAEYLAKWMHVITLYIPFTLVCSKMHCSLWFLL